MSYMLLRTELTDWLVQCLVFYMHLTLAWTQYKNMQG